MRFNPALALLPLALVSGCSDPAPPAAESPTAPESRPVVGAATDDVAHLEGELRRKTVVTSVYGLEAEQINAHTEPFRIEPFATEEPVWVRGWSVAIERRDGTPAPGDLQCHAMLSERPLFSEDAVFQGICTDGFTPEFHLPDGFGIRVEPGARWLFQPMFNNRRPDGQQVRMRIDVDFVPESERTVDYTPLTCFIVNIEFPNMYWVKGGTSDERTRVFEAPRSGRVHAIGGHIHPYGRHLELVRESTGELLHRAVLDGSVPLAEQRLSLYSSGEGFYLEKGESLRMNTLYENPNEHLIDAMGGFFIFFDPNGKPDA